MNTLTRTIAVLVVVNLFTWGPGLAQGVSEVELQDSVATEVKEANVAEMEAGIAARRAQKQAEMARRQASADERQKEIALARARSASVLQQARSSTGRSTSSSSYRGAWPFQSTSTGAVLVIPSAEMETKDLLTINEDINVMSRIFETNMQKARMAPTGGSLFMDDMPLVGALFSNRGRSPMQSLYLEGYGAVFLMKVDFPLSAPPQAPQPDEPEKEEEGDKVWRDTRIRMYEPEKLTKRKDDNSTVQYDAQKVENLKTTLIKALKHAANIRNLKTDESVVLSITGSYTVSSGVKSMRFVPNSDQVVVVDRNNITTTYKVDSSGKAGLGAPMVLTIRAKKADIDSFAKGDLDLEQFRQRVGMLSNPCLEAGSHRSDDVYRGLRFTPESVTPESVF